ncbi:phosphopantetheine-binding protein [Chengkuizengella sp. SCS-71B]|uniref:phosphopantetheine-binding protein n=1 Tax=Chengkuizengella sp. SCS-71B TaxID=3115290 RepID=UPI0032C21830
MLKEDFLNKVRDTLEEEIELDINMDLDDLEGWDSLGRLSIAALLSENFDKKVNTKTLMDCSKVEDIIHLIDEYLD